MTKPNWLPTEYEIKRHEARQREERLRMAQRVCDGPQTILMPTGATQPRRERVAGSASDGDGTGANLSLADRVVFALAILGICGWPFLILAIISWGWK